MADFGTIRTQFCGLTLECNAIAPGLSLQDLLCIFEKAAGEASPADSVAANPSRWPVSRGVLAVVNAVVAAMEAQPCDVEGPENV